MQWIIWTIGSYKFKHFAYLSPFLRTQAHKKWGIQNHLGF